MLERRILDADGVRLSSNPVEAKRLSNPDSVLT